MRKLTSASVYIGLMLALGSLTLKAHSVESPHITSLHACTDIKYRFATTRITSHVTNPSNQSRQAVFDIILPNDAFISNFTLELDGKVYTSQVEERDKALRRYGLNASAPKGLGSGGRVTQRPRESNQFRVVLDIGPQQGVTFNLTYRELLERRLGYYDHVLYINPGQPVDDIQIDVSIEENREISFLQVDPMGKGLQSDINITGTNTLAQVERPSGRQAHISYHLPTKDPQGQAPSKPPQLLSVPFTVRYDINRTVDAGELLSVNGYFVHFIAPPVQDPIPKDVLFILDTSTSMMLQKLNQLQDAMRVILSDLSPDDRFAIMQFNSRATFWRRELLPVTPTTIEWAMEYINSLKARGFTNIDSALSQGLQFFNEEPSVKADNTLIIFLTDGRPTRGETNRDLILSNVRAENRKKVAIYGLAFGTDADWPLVKRLASQNHGVGRRIYQDADAALQIQGFYSEVSTLLLTGVQALYLDSEVDVQTLTQTLFRKFFNGSELVIAGKLVRLNQTALQVLVQATGLEGKVNLTLAPDSDPGSSGEVKSCGLLEVSELSEVAEKMWAYLTIRQMLQQRLGVDDELKKQKLKDDATKLAMKYKFVTPVTSLVVNKPASKELAYLHEDDSDLVDEADILTAENISALLNRSRSQPGRGGGGGDPHFMVELPSLPYPLCYDIRGNTGDVFRLLKDPQSDNKMNLNLTNSEQEKNKTLEESMHLGSAGLTVNVEIEEHKTTANASRFYIVRVAILLQDIITEVTMAHAIVNDMVLEWDVAHSEYLPGVWVMMTNATLRFALDWGVEIDVTKHMRKGTKQHGQNYLNVEVQNEAHLSPDSSGLLGQFMHKDIRLHEIKRRHGRLVAELEIWNGRNHLSHGRAFVKNRRDPFFGRRASCLMVDDLWSRTLDRPTRFYKIQSIYET